MSTITENLNKVDSKIRISSDVLRLYTNTYDDIASKIHKLSDNHHVSIKKIQVIKQGSFKNKTMCDTKYNKPDLDMLVAFDGHYERAMNAKKAISNTLRANGYTVESKTRVLRVTKGKLSIDIMVGVFHNTKEGKILIQEKGTTKHKTIDPIGFIDWCWQKKGLNKNQDKSIDKEKYNWKEASMPINKGIRITKALNYEFMHITKKYIKSHLIEILFIDAYNGEESIMEIIHTGLNRINLFAKRMKNFYNPSYENEIIIEFPGKKILNAFVEFCRNKLKEFSSKKTPHKVNLAGISIIIPAIIPMQSGALYAGMVIPSFSKNFTHEKQVIRYMNRNSLKENIKWDIRQKNEVITTGMLIECDGYKFSWINKNGQLSFKPLFIVKNLVHTYSKYEICIAKKSYFLSIEQAKMQLKKWVQGYICYLSLGFWDHAEESKHKVENKNIFRNKVN